MQESSAAGFRIQRFCPNDELFASRRHLIGRARYAGVSFLLTRSLGYFAMAHHVGPFGPGWCYEKAKKGRNTVWWDGWVQTCPLSPISHGKGCLGVPRAWWDVALTITSLVHDDSAQRAKFNFKNDGAYPRKPINR